MAEGNGDEDELFVEVERAGEPSLFLGWVVLIVLLALFTVLGASLVRRGVEAMRAVNVPNPAASLPKIRLDELGQKAEEKVEAKAEAIVEQAAEKAAEKTVEKVKEEVTATVQEGVKKTLEEKLKGN